MPALTGETIMTLTDVNGAPAFVIFIFFDPTTRALTNQTVATSRGNRTGAIVIDNQTGKAQKMDVRGTLLNVATNGDVYSAATLSGQGFNVLSDLDGITPVIV